MVARFLFASLTRDSHARASSFQREYSACEVSSSIWLTRRTQPTQIFDMFVNVAAGTTVMRPPLPPPQQATCSDFRRSRTPREVGRSPRGFYSGKSTCFSTLILGPISDFHMQYIPSCSHQGASPWKRHYVAGALASCSTAAAPLSSH